MTQRGGGGGIECARVCVCVERALLRCVFNRRWVTRSVCDCDRARGGAMPCHAMPRQWHGIERFVWLGLGPSGSLHWCARLRLATRQLAPLLLSRSTSYSYRRGALRGVCGGGGGGLLPWLAFASMPCLALQSQSRQAFMWVRTKLLRGFGCSRKTAAAACAGTNGWMMAVHSRSLPGCLWGLPAAYRLSAFVGRRCRCTLCPFVWLISAYADVCTIDLLCIVTGEILRTEDRSCCNATQNRDIYGK
jgi:hypothetical protein